MAKKPTRRGRSLSLAHLDTAALHRELQRRQRDTAKLMVRRVELRDEIARLESELAALGGGVPAGQDRSPGRPARPVRRRPRNKQTLPQALAALLDGKTMSVTEATAAVQKAGYRTGSRNFRVQVGMALAKKGVFKRVSRGRYTAK